MLDAARLGDIARRICAELLAAGYPLPEDLRGWVKRRDRREPGRREKEQAEEKLAAILQRYWRRQRQAIRERLELLEPGRKATPTLADFDDLFGEFMEFDELADLVNLLQDAARHGIALFGQRSRLQIDWSLTNSRAAEWVRGYAFDLVRGINDITRDVLQGAISTFVETPGFTIGDVMGLLPFDEQRAQMVSVTEITRAYAEATQIAGEDLKKEFPDVRVMKQWFTNEDDLVCVEICEPLNGEEALIDQPFIHPETGEEYDNPPGHPRCRCWSESYTALGELD